MSQYKNIFVRGYISNWIEKVFAIKKVKDPSPWKYVTEDLDGEEIVGTFYDHNLQKTN